MAQPRPSLTLVLDLDQRLATEETRLEIARSYTHVGSAIVRTHEPKNGEEPENTMRMLVKLGNRKYLKSSDKGADELWNDVMQRWLHNEFHNVSNNMLIYNRRQQETDGEPLHFAWLEIELENGALTVRMRLDSASSVPAEESAAITAVRDAFNKGLLGSDAKTVIMPSAQSYATQEEAGLKEKARREAEEAAAKQAALSAQAAAQKAAEEKAAETFLESPELVEQAEQPAESAEEDAAAPYTLEAADFAIDYSVWDVVSTQGQTTTFDASDLLAAAR